MAEIAGFHVERMIPELEQIKRLNLFSQDELSDVIKKRKEFEYRIERSKKEKDDYLSYIKYEIMFLRSIKLRRDKYRIFEKKDEIEYAASKKVIKLYKMALLYFKSDYKLWLSYINFCAQTKFVNTVSEAFKHMLQVHGDKVHIWKHAVKWELEEMENMDGALNILKLGLHHHPASKELYTEAFTLELQFGAQKSKSDDKQQKSVARADIMFQTSLKPIGDDAEYIISLLEIASKFDFTKSLQKTIVDYMLKKCWKSELMWHTMALRELQGKHYDDNNENKSRILLCLSVYQSAIKVVPTSLMWEKYLDTLIDLYTNKKNIKETLESVLNEAFHTGFLTEKHYKTWVNLYDNNGERYEILIKATEALPQSVNLWVARIKHLIKYSEEREIGSVSKEAIRILNAHSLPVYSLLVEYSTLVKVNNYNDIKLLFEEGILKDREICMHLRPLYLEWLCLVKNLKVARQEYEKIANYTPHCLELHRKMIFLELAKPGIISIYVIRNIHKLACQQFGQSRTDVWLDFIKFELANKTDTISDIYNQAINILNPNLTDAFMTEFALLHI